jgi:hypothetical protein
VQTKTALIIGNFIPFARRRQNTSTSALQRAKGEKRYVSSVSLSDHEGIAPGMLGTCGNPPV